ncbi:hypothetical protein CEXT_599881 [Caerostris extrusa]|uniref:Uncharacterized protein n=1 Tax=Caerostris extrusa TaxID=172846 RepID=A0AAV4Y788_CAEEX|nr:hypothetical protein CEXT_599881 [Caerostris extrusa]
MFQGPITEDYHDNHPFLYLAAHPYPQTKNYERASREGEDAIHLAVTAIFRGARIKFRRVLARLTVIYGVTEYRLEVSVIGLFA